MYSTNSTAFFEMISLISCFNLLSLLGPILPVYGRSPITSVPSVLTVNAFLVPISIMVSPFVSGFQKNWSIGPANCVYVILNFSEN